MSRLAFCSIALLFLAGCGSQSDSKTVVHGTVTYKGKPVNGAALVLYSTKGKGESVTIPVTQEGTFRSSDLPEGEYNVVVQPSAGFTPHTAKGMDQAKLDEMKSKMEDMKSKSPPTIPIPEKYKKSSTTDLKMTITRGDQNFEFDLKD